MPRQSTIRKLPQHLKERLNQLLDESVSIEEITAALNTLGAGVSKSAVGRYTHRLAALGEKMRRSKEVAEALTKNLADAPESRTARANIALVHSAILDLFASDDGSDVTLDTKQVAELSKALHALTSASRNDAEFILRLQAEHERKTKAAVSKAVDGMAKEQGFSAATVAAIKSKVLGVKVP